MSLSPTPSPRGWQAVEGEKYLYRRAASRKLYARVRIPPGAGLPGTHKERSLRTENVSEAKRRLSRVVAELKGEIERARRSPSGHLKGTWRRSTEEEAEYWRQRLEADPGAAEELSEAMESRQGEPVGEERNPVTGDLEPVFDPEREREALAIYGLATGQRVPAKRHLDAFLSAEARSATYAARLRQVVRELGEWLTAQQEGDNLRRVGKQCAAAFIDHLRASGRHPATIRSLVSALRAYWRWHLRRALLAGGNPWAEQDLPKLPGKRSPDRKRAFTDEEMVSLLTGKTSRTLHDLMRLAALTGMRLNEIGRLTVGECAGGVFVVRRSKSDAGQNRRVPVHPDLKALVARRSAGKTADAQLLEELKASPSHPEDPARKAGERFTAYRRARHVGDAAGDRSHSRADFHSFRRWFITKAHQAGQPPHMISAVVGHEAEGITLGLYSQGPSDAQLRAVVEAVQLPAGVPVDSPEGPLLGSGGSVVRS